MTWFGSSVLSLVMGCSLISPDLMSTQHRYLVGCLDAGEMINIFDFLFEIFLVFGVDFDWMTALVRWLISSPLESDSLIWILVPSSKSRLFFSLQMRYGKGRASGRLIQNLKGELIEEHF